MAACRRVYYSRHLQADCQEPGSAPEPMLANRATFLSFYSTQLPGTRQKFASSRDFSTVNYSVQIMRHVHF